MKTRKVNQPNYGESSREVIEDPEINTLRLFALLYKIDQRNQGEKDVNDKDRSSKTRVETAMKPKSAELLGYKET
jgi:hypothetical protein